MRGALYGLGPVVLAIFAVAMYRLGRTAIASVPQALVGLAAAVALLAAPLGVASILVLSAAAGLVLFQARTPRTILIGVGVAILGLLPGVWWWVAPPAATVGGGVRPLPGLADLAAFFFGFIDLPAHDGTGGFDHAAVHEPSGRLYVAHTANDAVDVIDLVARRHVTSIPGLRAVAGALVTVGPDLVFTSNRGENSVGIFEPGDDPKVEKVAVGLRPNGLACDARRGRLLVAHVGDPGVAGSCTVSVIDVPARRRLADLGVAGRTRWAVYDPVADAFHVNIMDPPQMVVVGAGDPIGIRRVVAVPHAGPHGLDLDVTRRRLFCACDAGVLIEVNADTGQIGRAEAIAGSPDVVFFNAARGRVYVAIGDPGVIEVFDTAPLRRRATVKTEPGAHTLGFDAARNLVCAFLPATHRAALYVDHA